MSRWSTITDRERGQGTLEYVGVVAVAVLLVAGLVLGVSPGARDVAARMICEVTTLGQGDCASQVEDPAADESDDSWWCFLPWACNDDGDGGDEQDEQEDDGGWLCRTFGWFCDDDEPADDPTPTAEPTPTGHPTDPANGLPVVDGVTIPAGLDPDGETVQALLQTARGREALQWLADNGIEIRSSGQGSYWDGSNVYLASDATPLHLVRTIVHELNHAQASFGGTTPDVFTASRDDYVNGMLDEETRGVVAEILAARELAEKGVTLPLYTTDQAYWDAYDAAVAAGRSEEQARDAAFAAVREMFVDGSVVTSTTGETYEEYYGSAWDVRN